MEENEKVKEETRKLQVALVAWCEENGVKVEFSGSGGKVIIHFDKDENIRKVDFHRTVFKI